jgi:hypothetical protein
VRIVAVSINNKKYYFFDKNQDKSISLANACYGKFEEIIEFIINKKAMLYLDMLPTYEKGDIAQEMRIIALNSFKDFDVSVVFGKKKNIPAKDCENLIYMFVLKAITWRMFNIRRDKLVRTSDPCYYCKKKTKNKNGTCSIKCKNIHNKVVDDKIKMNLLLPYSIFDDNYKQKRVVKNNDVQLLNIMVKEAFDYNIDDLNNFIYKGEMPYDKRARLKKKLRKYFFK